MALLRIDPSYVIELAYKVRAVMAKEGVVDRNDGSNPTDDGSHDILQDLPGDLTREEFREEIQGLDPDEQLELVALLWLGRGDAEIDEWDDLLAQAAAPKAKSTEDYLLGHPLLAEWWTEALEKLGER